MRLVPNLECYCIVACGCCTNYLETQATDATVPPTSTSATANAATGTDNSTSTTQPVQTTTNTVPHIPLGP